MTFYHTEVLPLPKVFHPQTLPSPGSSHKNLQVLLNPELENLLEQHYENFFKKIN